MLQVLKHNLDRRADRVRVFELGRVFSRDAAVQTSDTQVAGIQQPLRIAGLAYGGAVQRQWSAKDAAADFFDIKGDVESLLAPQLAEFVASEHPAMHPGRCAAVLIGGLPVGVVGELHPKWRQGYELSQAPILFELDLEAVMQRQLPAAKAIGKFQDVERDIAVIVRESVGHAALMQSIRSADTQGLLTDTLLFDVYRPKEGSAGMVQGEKSLAVRLTLASTQATLTEDQIEAAVKAVLEQLSTDHGARLR